MDARCVSVSASKVLSGLWVGDWQDAKADQQLVKVTVAVDSPFIGQYHFHLVDGPNPGNREAMADAVKTVGQLRDGGTQVMVHCVSGISRSPAVVVGYLMHTYGLDYDGALSLVRKSRPIANPVPALEELVKEIYGGHR